MKIMFILSAVIGLIGFSNLSTADHIDRSGSTTSRPQTRGSSFSHHHGTGFSIGISIGRSSHRSPYGAPSYRSPYGSRSTYGRSTSPYGAPSYRSPYGSRSTYGRSYGTPSYRSPYSSRSTYGRSYGGSSCPSRR